MTLTRWTPVRSLARWDPFRDMLDAEHRMNQLLNSFFTNATTEDTGIACSYCPTADIAEHNDFYEVTIELPGIKKDDIKVTLENHTLTISGEKKFENEARKDSYHRIERGYGKFERSFTLPASVQTDKIDAKYNDGVLSLSIPKAEEAKPRAIEVKVS